ncbi:hypothetical protein AAZX31_02G144600 [Glycine max]
MYATSSARYIDEMDGDAIQEDSSSGQTKRPLENLDNEIAQITKLKCWQVGNLITPADRCHLLSRYLPVNGPWLIDQMSSRAYGSHIRIYNVDRGWKVQKNILAKNLRWTITDTSLSPDQRYLVYASMSPIVHIVNAGSAETESLANVTIWCMDFFHFNYGRELVAGSSGDSIYVYDLEANKLSLRILAHTSDVNTVRFADETSHLIYSGSDDSFCKDCFVLSPNFWSGICLIAKGKPAGVLMGHLEGITFIDTRGDGLYFISNGKDQTFKLWDIRKMSSNVTGNPGYRSYEWDYRWMDYPPQAKDLTHPCDQSVATYRGHSVLRTLIRCYFSPAFSTGQKYIYTGSHHACVYIYDLLL